MNEKDEIKNAIIYCRVSSKDQIEGTSLDSQERLAKEYAEKQGIKVLKTYVELGESAKTANRTEFNKALTYCADKKNKVSYFIVYKIDRFARNQDDHAIVRAVLKKAGVKLLSVTEPINDDSSVSRAMEGMLSVFAEFDNNVRTERTKQGMLERVKQGVWVWPQPLGYYRPAKGANIEPDQNIAPLILLGFEEYSKGTYTYESLAIFLGERGLKTKGGKNPYSQLVEKMLKNPVYTALINVWGEHEGSFKPIVPRELFNKCQEGYKDSVHVAPRSANNPLFPLRGTICTHCNKPITGSSSTGRMGKKYDYYHHANHKCDKSVSIPKQSFEQSFVEYLDEITPSGKYEKLFKATVIDIWKNNYQKFYADAARLRKDIDALEQERLKIFEFHRNGKYTDTEFEEQKQIANEAIYKKRRLVAEQSVEEFDMESALDYCFNFVRTTSKTWLEADYQSKLRFQKLVCKEKIKFDGQKFGTAILSHIYKINQEYGGDKSSLVALRGIEPRFSG